MSVDNYILLQGTKSPLQESLLSIHNINNHNNIVNDNNDNDYQINTSPLHIDNIKNDVEDNNYNDEYIINNNDDSNDNNNNMDNIGKELDTHTAIWSVSWIIIEEGKDIIIKNGIIATIFLLLNSMIGSGILVQAYVFRKSGIISVLFEYIIIGSMNYIGVNTLILLAEKQNIFDYSKLVKSILGNYGECLVDCCIVISGFGSLLSYILIIGKLKDYINYIVIDKLNDDAELFIVFICTLFWYLYTIYIHYMISILFKLYIIIT